MRYIVLLLITIMGAEGGIITDNLGARLNRDEGFVDAMVILHQKVNLRAMGKGNYKEKVNALVETAKKSQKNIVDYLNSHKSDVAKYRSFWISNAIYVKARPYIIRELASFPEVYLVKELSYWHILGKPSSKSFLKVATKDKTVGWNIDKIKADSVWAYYGYSGEGVDVGILDTGIDPDHPALAGNFSGHFHDAVNHNTTPYDDHGHGTHVAGTIAGGDGPGSFTEDIGVAYNASLSSCKAFDSQGSASDTSILECSEWFVSLKADSGVNIRVISNSWGGGHGQTWMWNDIWNNWRGMDIIPVFAAGNSGPGSETVGSPGDYPIVIGVGATDSDDNIADFSSRGPAPDTGLYADTTYWSRPDWNYIKPDISAPGAGIRSSVPGGNYDTWDGTSMATPHVTGVIALMLEKNPSIDYNMVYDILTNSAVDQPAGYTYPNNDYGWGRINALLAVENTPYLNQPFLKVMTVSVNDATGNNDGVADPGEHVLISVKLKNYGVDIDNVNATLSLLSDYSSAGTIDDNSSYYGFLAQDSTGFGDGFEFTVDSAWRAGKVAAFEINITGDGGYQRIDTIYLGLGTPVFYTWYSYDFASDAEWESHNSWALVSTDYHSAPSSFTDSPQGEYANDEHNYLVSQSAFDLKDAYFARVIFWHKYSFEKSFDYGYVQVSFNKSDTASWKTIASYTDSVNNWVCDTLNIPASFVGNEVYIRFLVESDGSVTRDGWYIDDVELQEDLPLVGPRLVNSGIAVNDSTEGNANGRLDPGENVVLLINIKNMGSDSAKNVFGQLYSSSSGVNVNVDTVTLGNLAPDSTKGVSFSVGIAESYPVGAAAVFSLVLTGDGIGDTIDFVLPVGEIYWTSDDTLYMALDNTDIAYTELAPVYDSVDISGVGTPLSLGDDDRVNVQLPFVFRFYGTNYTNIWVCSNGWISFGADPGTNAVGNDDMPSTEDPDAVIAGVWDDLDPSSGGGIYQYYDTANHRFIIQYRNVPFYSSSATTSFTIMLFDSAYYTTPTGDGDIIVQFDAMPGESDFSTGIENIDGTMGIGYYYNGTYAQGAAEIRDGSAVLFTTKSISGAREKTERDLFSAHIFYGNSFSPYLSITLPERAKLEMSIYDVSGRRALMTGSITLGKGVHTVPIATAGLPRGVYFVRIVAGKYKKVSRFVKLR